MRYARAVPLLACFAFTALACTTRPEHALPSTRVVTQAKIDRSNLIGYRKPARTDFQALDPPAALPVDADKLFAATCLRIVTTGDKDVPVQTIRSADGATAFRATLPHLRFHAVMDRKCSWWNPRELGVSEAHILEHEQIHFALFELEVRRMNASIEGIRSRVEATTTNSLEAWSRARGNLEKLLEKRTATILARSRKFDEDTSFGSKRAQQERWWSVVQWELGETAK